MLDLSFIPGQQDNVKIFYASDAVNWQTWTKPRGCSFVWIMCIGGGAGGASGGGTSTTTGAAGSGGGSGGIVRALYQATFLPDILFVQPGLGSAGAVGTTSAVSGFSTTANKSFVSHTLTLATDQRNVVCSSGNVAAVGATGETSLATLSTLIMTPITFAAFLNTAGNNGSTAAASALTSTVLCAGSGGGDIAASVANVGTSIASVDMTTMITPTISGGAATGAAGQSGIWSWKPMYGLGGAGGGANTSGAGGNGGLGISSSISGSSLTYGAGGRGANGNVTAGNTGVAGGANTGNGARGGGTASSAQTNGAKGGSGIVIIKF